MLLKKGKNTAKSLVMIYNKMFIYIVPLFAVFFFACNSKKTLPAPLFTLMDSTSINFSNNVKESRDDNGFLFRNFYNGGGVAIGDINNDGLPDVFLTSNQGENKLYLNKGAFNFKDISVTAGLKQDSMWSTGVTFVDINVDGWLDIYVCNSGNMKSGNRKNKLYINQHNNTFIEEAAKYGLDIIGYCTQASFFDYDLDGDLDCFIINNSPIPFSSLNYAGMRDVDISKWEVDEKLKGGGNHLYQNNGGRFTEITKEAGLHSGLISFGLGVSIGDINDDGYPDIYVGNDFIEKDYLYINQGPSTSSPGELVPPKREGRGKVTFKDELEEWVQKISMSSMSSDLADINNDGHPEIFTTDMIPDDDYRLKTTGTFDNFDLYLSKQKQGLYHQYVRNCLQLNNGNRSFSEIGNYGGVYGTDWSWGSVFFDADNDGFNDIFVCNGIAKDLGDLDFLDFFSNEVYAKMVSTGQGANMDELLKQIPVTPLINRVFRNCGHLQFQDVSKAWGLDQAGFSNSVAYADLDGDGDLDLVVNNENGVAFVYRNNSRQQNGNAYLGVQLKGKGGNTFAIGSKVKVYKGDEIFYRELFPSRGFQSSVDFKIIVGLGKNTAVDSMIVIWPDRTYSKWNNPELNRVHYLQQPAQNGPLAYPEKTGASNTGLQLLPTSFDKHTEDDYVDFYYERNLPGMLSKEGPHVAKGDVNGDGLEDVYIGGAKGQAGQLYLQKGGGSFVKKEQAQFKEYAEFEDVAVLFFDADRDGDLDLFIGSGGNNVRPGNREIQHRLYKNDGKGAFSIDTKAFPDNSMNISVAAAYDYDGDADEDLFVGSRSVPYVYGQTPQSYIYQNDGNGHYKDVTPPAIMSIGMVTGAVWADVTGDVRKELIITGEWMTTMIFTYNNNRFEEVKNTGLENLYGWWQSIAAADVNGDGKQDLVIGNIGENFYLRPNGDNPVKLWVSDFDGNGTPDQFLTRTVNKREVPVFLKREITDQFPFLKKDNLQHSDYAKKTIVELFGKKMLEEAKTKTFNYCSSIVAINNGKGGFDVNPLPVRTQFSSINTICPTDINGDNKIDLILGGNLFTFPPQFGRLDASYGEVLMNNGTGMFYWLGNNKSGLHLRGEVKDIQELKIKSKTSYIITQNNTVPVLYQFKD